MRFEEVFCNTFKAIRKTISPDVRKSVGFSIPSMPMVEACRADNFDFFAPFIAAGDLTVKQMQHACQRYYLGKTRSGQPIFWMMDDMLTPLDAHIGTSAWLSTFLKAREPLIASWQVTHCLFGLHLLAEGCSKSCRICVTNPFVHTQKVNPIGLPYRQTLFIKLLYKVGNLWGHIPIEPEYIVTLNRGRIEKQHTRMKHSSDVFQ